jgi:hypothetical protein
MILHVPSLLFIVTPFTFEIKRVLLISKSKYGILLYHLTIKHHP